MFAHTSIIISTPDTRGTNTSKKDISWTRTLSRAAFQKRFQLCAELLDNGGLGAFGTIPLYGEFPLVRGARPGTVAPPEGTSPSSPDGALYLPADDTFYLVAPMCCTCTAYGRGIASGGESGTQTDIDNDGNSTTYPVNFGPVDVVISGGQCRPNLRMFTTVADPDTGGTTASVDADYTATESVPGSSTRNAEHIITLTGGRFFNGYMDFTVADATLRVSYLPDDMTSFGDLDYQMTSGVAASFQLTREINGVRIGYLGAQGFKAQSLPTLIASSDAGDTGAPMQAVTYRHTDNYVESFGPAFSGYHPCGSGDFSFTTNFFLIPGATENRFTITGS